MNEKERSNEKKLMLNLGCGNKKIPRYVNIDTRKSCKPDLRCDASKLPYKENTVDRIIVSDLLEHFGRNETKKVLEHWHYILKLGGILIIKTPNVDTIISFYKTGKIPFEEFIRKMYGGQEYFGNYHYTGFNPENIKQLLTSVGFKIINLTEQMIGGDWSNMAIRCQK